MSLDSLALLKCIIVGMTVTMVTPYPDTRKITYTILIARWPNCCVIIVMSPALPRSEMATSCGFEHVEEKKSFRSVGHKSGQLARSSQAL